MCHTKSAPPSVIRRKERRSDASLKPSRKSRTKRRRPKYKSLSLKLNPDHQKNQNTVKKLLPPSSSSSKITKKMKKPQKMVNKTQKGKEEEEEELEEDNKRLIDLFPIRLRNLIPAVEEEDYGSKSDMQEVASFLFDSATDSTATLNGILSSTTTTVTTPTTTAASEECPLSSPLMMTYAYGGHDIGGDEEGIDGGMLVRTAMRRRRRDENEERWVSYNEVVEGKATMAKTIKKKIKKEKEKVIKEEEVVSRSSDRVGASAWGLMDEQQGIEGGKNGGLSLKLDYQEIMDAWSDKGPLYVDGEAPQIVPDLQVPNVTMDTWDNLWTVPDMANNPGGNSSKTNEDELGGKECWKKEHREASMLRYKEKRQNRLFSKRIRYEVRRLNAEKRPRIKGRFVKRSSET